MKVRNEKLDIVRGLAVIFVVFIHIKFPGALGIVGNDLGSLCNSLFFLIAGYFSLNIDKKRVLKKAINSLVVAILTSFFYMLLNLTGPMELLVGWIYSFPNIFIAKFQFCDNMWFAVALCYCYLLYYLIGENDKKFWLIILLAVRILFAVNELGLTHTVFVTIFQGVPVFFIGNYIATIKEKGFEIKEFVAIAITAVGLLMNFTNLIDVPFSNSIHILGSFVYAIGFFLWAIYSEKSCSLNPVLWILITIGEKYYLWFYIFQYMTIRLVHDFSDRFFVWKNVDYILPLLVVAILLVESWAFDKIWKNIPVWYKYLK